MKKSFHTFADAKRSTNELGITSVLEYCSKYQADKRLPGHPDEVYANSGWKDWYDFLGTTELQLYSSYDEAKSAAQKLGITSAKDYNLHRSIDSRLPSRPQDFYCGKGWQSWKAYLDHTEDSIFYILYSKAEAAVQALGIGTSRQYKLLCNVNARLPANPHVLYKGKGWVDWKTFLGKTSPYYKTYDEAASAAFKLNISSVPAYKSRRKEDPRLPPHPEILYADRWTNSYDFFGKIKRSTLYPTHLEAKIAAQILGIRRRDDYPVEYRKDERLPSNPDKFYKTNGWDNWKTFLGTSYYGSYREASLAAQLLGVLSAGQYRIDHYKDKKLPPCPKNIYREWQGWNDFLGIPKRTYYSLEEAQSMVKKMAVKTQAAYQERYSEDPQLPEKPAVYYQRKGWSGFRHFFGTEHYQTLSEARKSAQKLLITNSSEYKAHYRKDVRLPALPEAFYAQEWVSWYDFLSISKRTCYKTYDQARAAAQCLGIKSISEYRLRYLEDPHLPASPMTAYKDSLNWYDLLGNEKPDIYLRLSEAKLAVQMLGVSTRKQYIARYKENPRLPGAPEYFYSADGWTDWYDYLGTQKPINYTLLFPNFWRDVTKWLENGNNRGQKKSSLRKFLSNYYQPQNLPDDSLYLLMRCNPFNAEGYRQFIESIERSTCRNRHSHISSFYSWILKQYCTDEDGSESVVIPSFRNPFETVMAGFAESLQPYRHTQSTKTPLGYEYILRAREYLVREGEFALLKKPKLADLPHLQELFNSRTDWLEIDEARIDLNDPDCVWRYEKAQRTIDGKRKITQICRVWSPARFIALYTLLRFPLRGLQITLLDSGEADNEVPYVDLVSSAIKWMPNPSPLALKATKKESPQGAVQRGDHDLPKFHITTNKSGAGDDGYEIEWIPDDLVYWFLMLRDWQKKYNPLSQPTSWTSIHSVLGHDRLNERILKSRGTQCFLFRVDSSGRPLHTQTAFADTLPALLHRIQRGGENLAIPSTKGHYVTPYTPHSLRVSLITAFIADGNAPIHLISKLVGHTSLVMTIYYVKLNGQQMRRTMGETEKRAAQLITDKHTSSILMEGLRPLRDKIIVTDGNRKLLDSDVPNSSCVIFDWGVCPMSASSCHIGGLDSTPGRGDLAFPVPSGYLGQKNCTRCRFFITGIPFLGGLVALANEISLEIYTESGRFEGFSALVRELEYEYYDVIAKGGVDTKQWERKRATANEQQSGSKLDGLLNDYSRLNHFIQSCLALMNRKDDEARSPELITLVVAGELEDVGLAIRESNEQYHLLAEICQNASIYQSADPSRALPLISQAIDRMAENNHLKPAMFRLTDDQKLKTINELNQLLLSRLGSWERIDDLFSGDLMLLDIDSHRPEITRVSSDIQSILMGASSVNFESKEVDNE